MTDFLAWLYNAVHLWAVIAAIVGLGYDLAVRSAIHRTQAGPVLDPALQEYFTALQKKWRGARPSRNSGAAE